MPFRAENVQDIAVSGADKSIFVFVRFHKDGDPKFELFRDAAAEIEFAPPHDLEVSGDTTCAIYFWLTEGSDSDSHFEDDPCSWDLDPLPSVTYEYMMANNKGFSLKVNNWSPRALEATYRFQLKVFDGKNHHVSQDYEIDPTILEKGDETPPPGPY